MLAAIFGVLSAALMFAFLNSRGSGEDKVSQALTAGSFDTVWVANEDIAVGDEIAGNKIVAATLPVAAILTGAVKDDAEIVGKVATAPIFKGEQVTIPKVTAFANQTSLAYQVPQGKRALSLQVPHEAWINAGLPQPGDLVDIIVLMTLVRVDPLTGGERPDVVAGYLAQDVEVLAVSQTILRRIPKIDGVGANGKADPTLTDTGAVVQGEPRNFNEAISITLALTPEHAAKLAIVDALEDTVGQYRILTKRKGDTEPVGDVSEWSIDEVFSDSNSR